VPRAGLTTLRVVEEAADVADETGLNQLTLAAVADRLGVRLPSLYKHVEGRDALQRLVAIQATTELGSVLGRAAVGKAGIHALEAMFHACRAWARDHPGRYEATVRAPDPGDAEHTAAAETVVRVIFDVLSAYELRGDDAVDAVRVLRATLHGFITLERAGGFGMPVDINRTFDRIIAGIAETITGWSSSNDASVVG
jgi:AcrR family transcriptional regulator